MKKKTPARIILIVFVLTLGYGVIRESCIQYGIDIVLTVIGIILLAVLLVWALENAEL